MQIKDLLKRVNKNLILNKYRYGLIIVTVCISVLCLIFMRSIGYNIKNDIISSFHKEFDLYTIGVIYKGENQELSESIDLRLNDIKKIDGVEDASYENYILDVKIDKKSDREAVIEALKVKDYTTFSHYDELDNIVKILNVVNYILLMLGGIALIIAIINIVNSIRVSINERKYEIGIMRALGISFKDLKKIFFLENIITVSIGITLAILIKIIISPFIDKIFSNNIPFSFSGVESITYIRFFDLVMIIFLILLLVTFIILISLKRLKRIDITEVIKGE
ncbi:MAG: ABC transporter permease [Sarcina sp.]